MPTKPPPANLVRLLAAAGQPNAWLQRRIAELAQGVIAALKDSTLPVEEAWDELFNAENYQSILDSELDRDLRTLFEWGMELGTVAKHAPHSLHESFDAMEKLAKRVIAKSQGKRSAVRQGRPPSAGRRPHV